MPEIPLFQVCRNESFWKCTLPLKCQKLRPEYQMLLFDACCWTPTASSRPCCCRSSKVRQGPLRMTPFLRGFSSAAQVHYHFCQLSLLCKRALILKEASPSSHVTVQKRMVTTAPGILWQYAAQDCTAIKTFLYECPCLLSFMQTWPNAGLFCIKQPLIKHGVGPWRSCGVCAWDMKLIFMLSKMHCWLHSGCCICAQRTCRTMHNVRLRWFG